MGKTTKAPLSIESLSTDDLAAELQRRNDEQIERQSSVQVNPGKLMAWNKALRERIRRLPGGFDIMKELGFRAAYLLPVIQSYDEKNQISKRNQHFDVPAARDAQLIFRRVRIGPGGAYEEAAKTIVIDIVANSGLPPDTTRGKHITAGYTSEDALRAIFGDPNWCVNYLIYQMTEDDIEYTDKVVNNDEYLEAVARREQAMADGAAEIAAQGVLDRSI